MRDVSSFAAATSSGVGGPFFARTSCICSRLLNTAAKTSLGFPVVRGIVIVSRRRNSRLVSGTVYFYESGRLGSISRSGS